MAKKQATIYLDHAAGTPTDSAVVRAMLPYFSTHASNPSAMYAGGVEAREAIEKSRAIIANFLKTQSDCVYFTSGGTEANNIAIFGAVKQNRQDKQSKHVITTTIEHSSVLEPIRQLEREGWMVTYLPVNREGLVSVEDFEKALRPETVLVSIMYANNEVGSIQPIADIGRAILQYRKKHATMLPYFHVDACQATEYLPMEVDALHADLLTINAAKVYGPKGVGVLYKRRGVILEPLMFGGRQERGVRSGTENVPGIVGFGKAVELIDRKLEIRNLKLSQLRNYFWKEIKTKIKNVDLNGPPVIARSETRAPKQSTEMDLSTQIASSPAKAPRNDSSRLPNNLNVSFKGCDAEALILYLSARGIAVSAGSACSTDSGDVSHVLLACGLDEKRAKSSIRFTFGRSTTKKQIDFVIKNLVQVVDIVRKMT